MTLEDPFFVVKDEVIRAVDKTQALFERWLDLRTAAPTASSRIGGRMPITLEELDLTQHELKNSFRSIDWDLEDLEETISIVENNRQKFKIDDGELESRRDFIRGTKKKMQIMKDQMNSNQDYLLDNSKSPVNDNRNTANLYTKLDSSSESPNRLQFIQSTSLSRTGEHYCNSNNPDVELRVLKDSTEKSATDLENENGTLSDFGNEVIIVNQSKFDATMKRVAKALHMSNGNYGDYSPAPTVSCSPTRDENSPYGGRKFVPRRTYTLSSITTTLANCFICARE